MSESEAKIYYISYKALLEELDSQPSGLATPKLQAASNLEDFQVDVRCFAIFVALQLFTQQANENAASYLKQDSWGEKKEQKN